MNEILASLQEKEPPRGTLSHRGKNEKKADEVGAPDAKEVLKTGLSPHSRLNVPQESGPIAVADSETKQV